jgi:RPA family protein
MSESGDSGPGRREVAHRLFAAEFDDAEFSYSESDEERAPNYVVTPTGARVNRLFVVGVLTELEQVNEDVLRARIVDPTGPFVVYAGQYQPEALAFLEAATPPLFVAVTGKARTFEPEDGDRVFTSVRPESISEVDAETRDRWVVQAAEQTVARVGRMASARQSDLAGEALQEALVAAGVAESDAEGTTLALDYYDTTGDYLQAVRGLALNAARVVAGERDEAGSLSRAPGDGTDDPLAALATMTLEAPDETASAGPSDVGDESDESTPADSVAPESTGDSEAADTDAVESTTDTGTPESTGDSAAAELATDTEPSSTAERDDTAAAETVASAGTDEEPSTETTTETTGSATEANEASEPTTDAESASAGPEATSTADTAGEGNSGELGNFDSAGATDETSADADASTDDEVGDFDTEFELDEDEREEIEEEYGTDFQSGTEVDDAGEAGIETPDPEELAEAEAEADASGGTESVSDEGTADSAAGGESDDEATTDEPPATDVDLEDAVMDVMTDLNDGSGADREAVITEVMDAYGTDRDAVEDAVQDALMGGRCYEPDDGKLTPI